MCSYYHLLLTAKHCLLFSPVLASLFISVLSSTRISQPHSPHHPTLRAASTWVRWSKLINSSQLLNMYKHTLHPLQKWTPLCVALLLLPLLPLLLCTPHLMANGMQPEVPVSSSSLHHEAWIVVSTWKMGQKDERSFIPTNYNILLKWVTSPLILHPRKLDQSIVHKS